MTRRHQNVCPCHLTEKLARLSVEVTAIFCAPPGGYPNQYFSSQVVPISTFGNYTSETYQNIEVLVGAVGIEFASPIPKSHRQNVSKGEDRTNMQISPLPTINSTFS